MVTPTVVNKEKYKGLCTHIHSNIIHYCFQKMETMQVPLNSRVGKENMVYMHNGILLSLKKEQNPDMCYSMDEP